MRTVSARDANQNFSRLLKAVAEGEEVVITRRGKAVARLSPVHDERATSERTKTAARLLRRLEKGWPLGGLRVNREELYER